MTPHLQKPSRRQFLEGLVFPAFFWVRPKTLRIAGAEFEVVRNGKSQWRFLHIHGDETTASDVLREAMKKQRGTAFFVKNDERNVPVSGGWIDPNRMFSRDGAERSLRRVNDGWSDAQVSKALAELDKGRDKFVRTVLPPKGGILVSMHNNSRGYSMKTEIPISDKVSVKDEGQMFDFLLVTHAQNFAALEKSPFNCVLQATPKPPDDGSLSRLCAARGVRYVNIEAAMGEKAAQAAMLGWCLSNLR